MPVPARFPSGVNDQQRRAPLANLPFQDPFRTYAYIDEFNTYTSGNWTKTSTGAGTAAVNTGAAGGILALTNSTGNTDVNQIQLINETFKYVAGKQLWLRSRFAATATLANFGVMVGLAITDTTAVAGVSDGIFFRKPTGSSSLSAVICKNATETTVTLGTMTSGTYVDAVMYYDGRGNIECWLDGVKIGTMTDLTNMVDDEELAVTIASVNATAGAANVLAVDTFMAAIER